MLCMLDWLCVLVSEKDFRAAFLCGKLFNKKVKVVDDSFFGDSNMFAWFVLFNSIRNLGKFQCALKGVCSIVIAKTDVESPG